MTDFRHREQNIAANGRIDILGDAPVSPFILYDQIPVYRRNADPEYTSYIEAMTGNWTDTPLSVAFFSKENIRILQNGIRAGVYKLSGENYVIPPQDEDTLKIIMRSIFLEHAANMPTNIRGQIEALNNLVYDYAIPQIYNELQAYLKYKHDASTLVMPIAHPVNNSTKHKTLELNRFL